MDFSYVNDTLHWLSVGDSSIQKLKCAHVLGLKSIMDEHHDQASYLYCDCPL